MPVAHSAAQYRARVHLHFRHTNPDPDLDARFMNVSARQCEMLNRAAHSIIKARRGWLYLPPDMDWRQRFGSPALCGGKHGQ